MVGCELRCRRRPRTTSMPCSAAKKLGWHLSQNKRAKHLVNPTTRRQLGKRRRRDRRGLTQTSTSAANRFHSCGCTARHISSASESAWALQPRATRPCACVLLRQQQPTPRCFPWLHLRKLLLARQFVTCDTSRLCGGWWVTRREERRPRKGM